MVITESFSQEKLQVNTWVEIKNDSLGNRNSFNLFYIPSEKSFICLGGAKGDKDNPYSEMTFNQKSQQWENRFPGDKLGAWGKATGSVTAPKFAYRKVFVDVEGNVRPKLSYGYMRSMALYHNSAYDKKQNKAYVYWHVAGMFTVYDVAKREWEVLLKRGQITRELQDDLLWGSLCFDSHNNEILGGQGRWVYNLTENKWSRLSFENGFISPIKEKATALEANVKRLKAAVRSRFYMAENQLEAKLNLKDLVSGINNDIATLDKSLKTNYGKAKGQSRLQLKWALGYLKNITEKSLSSKALLETINIKSIASLDELHELALELINTLEWVPPKRANSPLVYDEDTKKILMFGGDRQEGLIADTWVYDVMNKNWSQCRPLLSPAPSAGHALSYSSESKKSIYVNTRTNQCWAYDMKDNEWAIIKMVGEAKILGYGWHPGTAVLGDGGLLIKVCAQRKKPPVTFMTKLDVSQADKEMTRKLGVTPGSKKPRIVYKNGKSQPQWHEKNAGEISHEKEKKVLDNLPTNTWVKRIVPDFKRGVNRAWSSAVFDPEREVILHWGGGHSAHCGNNVLMYSTRTNRYFSGTRPEYSLDWGTGYGSNLCPPARFTYKGGPFLGHQRSYAFDVSTGKLITPNYSGKFFTYDPKLLDWTTNMDIPFKSKSPGSIGAIAMCSYTNGVAAYLNNKLYLYDSKKKTWEQCPTKIKLPPSRTDRQGISFDSNRNRLLLFSSSLKGDVISYDLKRKTALKINPGWKKEKVTVMREVVYVKHLDCVFTYSAVKTTDGKFSWALFDCKKNKWFRVALSGTGPFGVSTGLVYDPKKKLIWMMDTWSQVYVLKPDFSDKLRANIE